MSAFSWGFDDGFDSPSLITGTGTLAIQSISISANGERVSVGTGSLNIQSVMIIGSGVWLPSYNYRVCRIPSEERVEIVSSKVKVSRVPYESRNVQIK